MLKKIKHLSEVAKHMFVSFVYESGTRAGQRRRVFITEIDRRPGNNNILGFDLEANGIRSYTDYKATDIYQLPTTIVGKRTLIENITEELHNLDMEKLTKIFCMVNSKDSYQAALSITDFLPDQAALLGNIPTVSTGENGTIFVTNKVGDIIDVPANHVGQASLSDIIERLTELQNAEDQAGNTRQAVAVGD